MAALPDAQPARVVRGSKSDSLQRPLAASLYQWPLILLPQGPHVAQDEQTAVVKRALSDVGVYLPQSQSIPNPTGVLPAGPAPHVAKDENTAVVKRALSDVGVYLGGARWEVLHRKAMAETQLLVRTLITMLTFRALQLNAQCTGRCCTGSCCLDPAAGAGADLWRYCQHCSRIEA